MSTNNKGKRKAERIDDQSENFELENLPVAIKRDKKTKSKCDYLLINIL